MRYDPVALKDAQFLYDLLFERPSYANISHKEMPTYDSHCAFIKSKPYREWFVVRSDQYVNFGTVYLSHQNEMAVFIIQKYQRLGIGTQVAHWMIDRHPKDQLYANVSPNNLVGQNFVRRLGGKPIQITYQLVAK